MILLIHSQTSTVPPLKLGNGYVKTSCSIKSSFSIKSGCTIFDWLHALAALNIYTGQSWTARKRGRVLMSGMCGAGLLANLDKWVTVKPVYPLKRKCRHFDEILITGCTGSCHFDNFQCSQWWKFHQNEDISVSVSKSQWAFVKPVSRETYRPPQSIGW